MSNLFDVFITLHSSKKAIFFFGSLYLLGLISLFFTEIILIFKIILMIIIFAHGYYIFTRYILLSRKNAIVEIDCCNALWSLRDKNGKTKKIELIQLLSFQSKVILLRFSTKKKSVQTLFLFNDNMTPKAFHHLLLLTRLY